MKDDENDNDNKIVVIILYSINIIVLGYIGYSMTESVISWFDERFQQVAYVVSKMK